MTTVSRTALEDALVDADYPATKDDLLAVASSSGAATDDVLRALRSLPPEVTFANAGEVLGSVNAVVEG